MAITWYVLRSKPNKEDFLSRQLELSNVEVFNPRLHVKPVNPRARKTRPYFPGYIFVHFDLLETPPSSLERLPGAANLLNFGGEAASVPDSILEAIRKKVENATVVDQQISELPKPGDQIKITGGPLEGYEGIFDINLPGTERVRVLLRLLQNTNMRVELPLGHVEKKRRLPRAGKA